MENLNGSDYFIVRSHEICAVNKSAIATKKPPKGGYIGKTVESTSYGTGGTGVNVVSSSLIAA